MPGTQKHAAKNSEWDFGRWSPDQARMHFAIVAKRVRGWHEAVGNGSGVTKIIQKLPQFLDERGEEGRSIPVASPSAIAPVYLGAPGAWRVSLPDRLSLPKPTRPPSQHTSNRICWSMMAEKAQSCVRQFLEALFGRKPQELLILIWTITDKRSGWFGDVESAIRYAESMSGQDVFVGVGLSDRTFGPDRRCPSNEIAAIAGLWVDIDLQTDAHPKTTLPCTVDEALSILPADLPPTFIIFTGNGIHVWLLFRELYLFSNGPDRAAAAFLSKRWNTLIRDNARIRGWKIDRLADLARLLRIPGTTNCKDPSNPKAVVIHRQSDNRYTPSDLAKYLDGRGARAGP